MGSTLAVNPHMKLEESEIMLVLNYFWVIKSDHEGNRVNISVRFTNSITFSWRVCGSMCSLSS
jgi:hypothetical protein